MKYVSLDIETTGLDPARAQILQVAMVLEDSDRSQPIEELPHFVCLVKPLGDRYVGNAYALALNADLLSQLAGRIPARYPIYDSGQWHLHAWDWLCALGMDPKRSRLTVAGKNVAGFDIPFLPPDVRTWFRHRVIDAGSVMIDWSKDRVPSLEDLKGGAVAHDALEDARDVIRVLRRSYGRRSEVAT